MKVRTITITMLSILIGFLIAIRHDFISGINPFLGTIFEGIIGGIFIWTLILIYRESNRKLKLIQLTVLISAIGIGIYKVKTEFDLRTKENTRIYYQTDTELENGK